MRMEPTFEKANEIYFRLGIIYKQQQKFNQSLDVRLHCMPTVMGPHLTRQQCFKYIVTNPPRPLTEEDIWFQIGHVYEQQKEVCAIILLESRQTKSEPSSKLQRARIAVCSNVIQITPRCSNS